jgi:membrane-associated phospholipid phosphatase
MARPTRGAPDVVAIVRRVRVLAALLTIACHDTPTQPAADTELGAGQWRAWTLATAAALRPAPPPVAGSAEAARDLDEVLRMQGTRSAATDVAIRRWRGSPTAPWDSVALGFLDFYFPLLPDVRLATPVRAARTMTLLHIAAYDALLATYDAKVTYRRPAPTQSDARVRALIDAPALPSYPSEHAAVAAAAAAVLSYLYPQEDTLAFHALAHEAGAARIIAGAAFPSDVAAGEAIGEAVAARVLARARVDGADVAWSGTTPVGPDLWRPTPNKFVAIPFDAGAGGWGTWVLPSGDAMRPPPPPASDSRTFTESMTELRALSTGRSAQQADIARYWATDAPSVIWEKYMLAEISARALGPVHAARAQAYASVAMYDAFVACWDAKFTYWLRRPITAEPTLKTVFPTPPFPSYPSGHSTVSSAAGEVFAELFPDAATAYRARATEASLSRVYAGVHYRFDVETGDSVGVHVGQKVVERMRADGASR